MLNVLGRCVVGKVCPRARAPNGKKSDIISRMYAMFVQFTLFQSDPKFTLPPSDRIESDPCTALSSAPSSFHNIGEKSILHTVTLTSAKQNKRIVCHERANSLSFCSTDTIEYLISSIRTYAYVLVLKNFQ